MTQMNAWIRGFTEKVNEIFTAGFDVNDEPGSIIFTGTIRTGGQYNPADLVAGTGNGLYELTAGNFAIWAELMSDADRLGSKGERFAGVEQCEQVHLMYQLLDSKQMFSFRNGSAKDFLEMLQGDVALNASNANTFYNTYRGLANSIDNQRNSISGVDEDEEASNLVKFQYAYNLSSRMIQTLSEIYNRLILQTGV
jgi:flagellar hook-associated protein 1 FlgK